MKFKNQKVYALLTLGLGGDFKEFKTKYLGVSSDDQNTDGKELEAIENTARQGKNEDSEEEESENDYSQEEEEIKKDLADIEEDLDESE